MQYLKEADFNESMSVVYSDLKPAPLTHTIWVGDFMGMAKHDVACPVCFNNKAITHLNCDSGERTFQPCSDCQEDGFFVGRIPRWLRWVVHP